MISHDLTCSCVMFCVCCFRETRVGYALRLFPSFGQFASVSFGVCVAGRGAVVVGRWECVQAVGVRWHRGWRHGLRAQPVYSSCRV